MQGLAVGVVAATGLGGLVAAGVVKYLDNIAKIYCAALASTLIGILTHVLFPATFSMGLPFVAGTLVVLGSAAVYTSVPAPDPPPPRPTAKQVEAVLASRMA